MQKKSQNMHNNQFSLVLSVVLLFITIGFSIPSIVYAVDYEIPSSRRTTWEGNVGVDGGIPTNYTKYGSTIETATQGDDTSAIQNALNASGSQQYVELGSGTFTIGGTISVPSYTELRGQGMGITTLDLNGGSGETGIIQVKGVAPWVPASSGTPSWDAGYTQGTTEVTLSDASGISTGDTVVLDVVNDESTVAFRCMTDCQMVGTVRDSATRGIMQVVEVMGVDGNTLTIDPPLFYDYPSGQTPSSYKITTSRRYAGIRDFTVDGAGAGDNYNIQIGAGNNLWALRIESYISKRAHISVRSGATKVTIRGCYLHEGQSYNSVSYGFELGNIASAILVENNIVWKTVTPVVTYGPVSGSVIAYNYFVYCAYAQQASWLTPSVGFHGLHVNHVLLEGNIMWGASGDNWWGSSSHNTIFRNRLYGYQSTPITKQYNAWGVQLKKYSHYYNIIGNIIGTDGFHTQYEFKTTITCSPQSGIYETGSSGNCATGTTNDSTDFSTLLRHMNYDYVNDSTKECGDSGEPGCQGGPTDTDLVDSLYYSSRPPWWDGSPWPPIGPDLNPMVSNNPAKNRYEGTIPVMSPPAGVSVVINE